MKKAAHSLLLAVIASAMLLPVFASQHEPIGEREAIQIRAVLDTSAANPEPSAAAPVTTQAATSAAPTTSTTAAAIATSAAAPTSAASPTSAAGATTTHAGSTPTSTTPVVLATSLVATTDAAGQVITSYIVSTPTMSSPPPSNTSTSDDDSGGGLSTGSIVGLSVSGGIAALGIILFFVWKFTRKRFSDFDDNEAIKWPELNAHNNDVHALPTNSTGRSGFGPENDSDINLTRPASPAGGYANSIAASSVPEMYGGGDPYAVPPLPHLNPNQPYHDEPGAYGQSAGYYDPYRGPVPNAFNDPIADGHVAESIPMTQMARIRSPGPQVAYDMQGRGSPVPQVAYDMQGRGSPVPQAAMGHASMDERSRTPIAGAFSTGRASPSPHAGYGYGSR